MSFQDAIAAVQNEYDRIFDERVSLLLQLDVAEDTIDDLRNQLPPEPRVRLGVNQGGLAELEPALGVTLRALRAFSDGPEVFDALTKGRKVYLSVRSPSEVPAIVANYSDADLTLIVHHEPENDTTPAAYQAEQREAASLIPPNMGFAPVLMAATYNKGQPSRWIPPDVAYTELGVDGYLRGYPWTTAGFDYTFKGALAEAAAGALPLAICEVGVLSAIDAVVVPELEQATEIERLHRIIQTYPDIVTVCWFEEQVTKDAVRDYRIAQRAAPLARFRGIACDPLVVP